MTKSEAAKLPVGRIKSEADLKSALLKIALQLVVEKAKERQGLEALIAKYPGKPALLESMEALKEHLGKAAKQRAKQVRLKGDPLDDAYDRAHGPYASIPSLLAFPSAGVQMAELADHLRRWHEAQDPQYRPPLTISRVGELLIVTGATSGEIGEDLSRTLKRPVLGIGCAAAFEKEAWSYWLIENGQEIDRHTSDPFALPVVYELLDEGEEVEFVRRIVRAEGGDPRVLARCFSVEESQVRPYLIQIFSFELEKIWRNSKFFIELKAFPEDRYSLAGPWHFLDLLKRLGRAESSDGIWDHEVSIPAE